MKILSSLILLIALLWVGWQVLATRRALRQGEAVMPPAFAATLVFALSILLVLILGASPLHLIWLFPVSIVLGFKMLLFPWGVNITMACLGLLAGLKPHQKP